MARRVAPLLLGMIAVIAASCTSPLPSVAPPAVASQGDGRYTMTLALPKDTWAAGEPITGLATLSLEPGPDVQLSGSGGPIGFTYTEVNGTRKMEPVFTADCAPHPLTVLTPIQQQLTKSGAWDADQPDGDFYKAFYTGDGVRLPAGDWDIRVMLAIGEGEDCSGRSLTMDPAVRIHVTP